MAESLIGAVIPTPETKFFCHKCTVEIPRVLPDYTCPTCNSGFIEEINPNQDEDNDMDSSDETAEPGMADFMSVFMQDMMGASDPMGRPSLRRHRMTLRSQPAHVHTMPLENILQDILVNITGMDFAQIGAAGGHDRDNRGVRFFVGNPGDYAWGREGLDAIVTQLLNQMDGTGPAPLAEEKIQSLPSVEIAQEQVDQCLQCSVCWEDFKKGESVRKLPCDHVYHDDCIIPWLKIHGTCPICRKVLNEDAAHEDQARTGPTQNAAASLPQSIAAFLRAANSGGSSASSSSTSSSSSRGNSSTDGSNSSAQQRQRSPPSDGNHFWDMDMDCD
ncbi:E3 ubiquitin-protein ligase Iruka [Neocloeon triangulifer]|uniref:E3 ubiquitin-protein ligase Iruka n=1 Tax=Neocloeon triangulifer TaxID=2078957 RepID=UPI00286ECFC7|nr:E3 ubiquitin-protein ligase Iruka [Neocloeon triangulifer]